MVGEIEVTVTRMAELLSRWAQAGVKKFRGRHGRMCKTCAFRKGSETQMEAHNVRAAAQCLAGTGMFQCHKHDANNKLADAGKPCAGFMYAKDYSDSL